MFQMSSEGQHQGLNIQHTQEQ